MIQQGIQKLINKVNLTHKESCIIMEDIMKGKATNAQIASFLTAIRMKGETVNEITAFSEVMKGHCHRIHPLVKGRLVDVCGTGGDKIKTFNISTTAAFIVAGAGISIAKHGNRSVTSKSGSADILEKLGFNLNMEPGSVEKSIQNVGIGFMFAPAFHPAMKYAIGPRRELGFRTVFNILGPLTNPADANAQVVGVYDQRLTKPIAEALKVLGCEEAMIVHGIDGLDELSTIGRTVISWLKEGEVTTIEKTPKDFGIKRARPEDVQGTTPRESAEITYRILNRNFDSKDPKTEIVLLNSVAGIIVAGKADDFGYGMELARESINSGAAYKKLKALVKASNGSLAELKELELKYD